MLTCSAISGERIADVWQMVLDHHDHLANNGWLERQRKAQALEWMHELVRLGITELFQRDPAVSARWPTLEDQVRDGRVSPLAASRELLGLFRS